MSSKAFKIVMKNKKKKNTYSYQVSFKQLQMEVPANAPT